MSCQYKGAGRPYSPRHAGIRMGFTEPSAGRDAQEVPVLLLSVPGAGAEETVSRPGLSSLWGDGVERAEETDPEEEEDDDTSSTSSSDEDDGSVTDQEEYDDRSGRVCPLSPREVSGHQGSADSRGERRRVCRF